MVTDPKEPCGAGEIAGSGTIGWVLRVILPVLRPVMVGPTCTAPVPGDLAGPVRFLPGDERATVRLTLDRFRGQSLGP